MCIRDRKYAGGLSDRGSWKKVTVEHPNGEIKKTLNFGLFTISPKVSKGAQILVGVKPPKVEEKEEATTIKKSETDWDKILTQVLAVTSVLATLLIAIDR